jgi:two-component system cell cycle response regulator
MTQTPALRKVLLIDDDRAQARIVDAAFGKFVGERFELHWAATYEDGLLALRETAFTACLLDYQLGVRSGLELLREVVRLEIDTPVIFLTSETSGEVDTEALNLGAFDYMVKFELSPRALERSLRYSIKMHDTLAELRRLATRDQLTGLYNRREGIRLLDREVERAAKFGRAFTMLLIDVDHFKAINDTHGHAAGDQVLTAVAHALEETVREAGTVVRWGGDEFAVWAPHADAVAGRRIGEEILAAARKLGCTLSIGLAEWNATRESGRDLIAAADRALYDAKAAGRDRLA